MEKSSLLFFGNDAMRFQQALLSAEKGGGRRRRGPVQYISMSWSQRF